MVTQFEYFKGPKSIHVLRNKKKTKLSRFHYKKKLTPNNAHLSINDNNKPFMIEKIYILQGNHCRLHNGYTCFPLLENNFS